MSLYQELGAALQVLIMWGFSWVLPLLAFSGSLHLLMLGPPSTRTNTIVITIKPTRVRRRHLQARLVARRRRIKKIDGGIRVRAFGESVWRSVRKTQLLRPHANKVDVPKAEAPQSEIGFILIRPREFQKGPTPVVVLYIAGAWSSVSQCQSADVNTVDSDLNFDENVNGSCRYLEEEQLKVEEEEIDTNGDVNKTHSAPTPTPAPTPRAYDAPPILDLNRVFADHEAGRFYRKLQCSDQELYKGELEKWKLPLFTAESQNISVRADFDDVYEVDKYRQEFSEYRDLSPETVESHIEHGKPEFIAFEIIPAVNVQTEYQREIDDVPKTSVNSSTDQGTTPPPNTHDDSDEEMSSTEGRDEQTGEQDTNVQPSNNKDNDVKMSNDDQTSAKTNNAGDTAQNSGNTWSPKRPHGVKRPPKHGNPYGKKICKTRPQHKQKFSHDYINRADRADRAGYATLVSSAKLDFTPSDGFAWRDYGINMCNAPNLTCNLTTEKKPAGKPDEDICDALYPKEKETTLYIRKRKRKQENVNQTDDDERAPTKRPKEMPQSPEWRAREAARKIQQ
ncbi:hypothetical protein EJ02DRAFT_432113 [Clathrospora elynae]|uniref:Uncharacterized protein n=1 Tax=Clathrospora elynae TaxID=706981 RepID=A0A6A5SYK3_9PLEO|nr:hypothetical protein EJ02DRAFT_432113 [Clathrospora elynae]